MNNFDKVKSKNIDEFAEWLDKHGDDCSWVEWFSKNYCSKCEPVMCHYENSEQEFPCCWCELHDNKCKFFPELDEAPDNKQIIKMWLENEYEEE